MQESSTSAPTLIDPLPAGAAQAEPSPASQPRTARAYPPIVTGLLGGGFIGSMMVVYAVYALKILPGGGPTVTGALRWMTFTGGARPVARDFFDFWAIMLLGYVGMAAFEKLAQRWYRRLLLGLMLATVVLGAAVAGGAHLGTAESTFDLGGMTLTRMELVFGGGGLGMLLLIGAFALLERRDAFDRSTLRAAARSGFWRWLAAYSTLLLVAGVTFSHPLLQTNLYGNWRLVVSYLLALLLFPGLPYFILTNWMRHGRGEDQKDAGFGLLVVYRFLFGIVRPGGWRRFRRILSRHWVRTNLMDLLCVKFFFMPVMVGFLFQEGGALRDAIGSLVLRPADSPFPGVAVYEGVLRIIMVLDVAIGCIGYGGSSRWLGNKSRSVDPTLFGWVVALMCYPPFNNATGDILPAGRYLGPPAYQLLPGVIWSLRIITLVCFAIYMLSTLAFGLRFSNMTHRGIIKQGPYAVVRHPAYICKVVAWWAEQLPGFCNIWQPIGLVILSGVYWLRALTEERHLERDPEYRAYRQKVRWRFLPGIY